MIEIEEQQNTSTPTHHGLEHSPELGGKLIIRLKETQSCQLKSNEIEQIVSENSETLKRDVNKIELPASQGQFELLLSEQHLSDPNSQHS